MAATQVTAVLRQRVCGGCRAVFFICPSCDRGHRYCSPDCRDRARLQQRRCANLRHQRSVEGRLDHRDRQRQYRRRCQQVPTRVTDQASVSITSPASSECGPRDVMESLPSPQSRPVTHPSRWLSCRICGCAGRFIDPFPRIPRGR